MFTIMESGSLVKAFSLIEQLADRQGAASLNDLALGARVTKPSAHRLLQSLIGLGYVQHETGGIYRLTPKLRWLAMDWTDGRLATVADPILRQLHADTGETVNLGTLRGDRICYITTLESAHALRRVTQGEAADPVLCTALGRAIAAHLSPSPREQLLRTSPPQPRTPKTVINVDELRRILTRAHQQGFAVERDQTDLGVTCIAAPVIVRGDPVAAISLSIPSARVDGDAERRWISQVRAAASSLGDALASAQRASA